MCVIIFILLSFIILKHLIHFHKIRHSKLYSWYINSLDYYYFKATFLPHLVTVNTACFVWEIFSFFHLSANVSDISNVIKAANHIPAHMIFLNQIYSLNDTFQIIAWDYVPKININVEILNQTLFMGRWKHVFVLLNALPLSALGSKGLQ